jgi:hypothetical protein
MKNGKDGASQLSSALMDIDLAALPDDVEKLQQIVRAAKPARPSGLLLESSLAAV